MEVWLFYFCGTVVGAKLGHQNWATIDTDEWPKNLLNSQPESPLTILMHLHNVLVQGRKFKTRGDLLDFFFSHTRFKEK